MKDGIVGLNMSRWQRQQLLAGIRDSPHPYVWLDALSIPAALLLSRGHASPEQDSWLHALSNTLLTRMMAVYAAGASTIVLRSSEPDGGRYHQRAWTMQEFCGSRFITVRSEDGANQVPYTREEDSDFTKMRRSIKRNMTSALPLWGQRLLDAVESGKSKAAKAREDALIRGVEAFAKAQAKVTCQEPLDKVRALLPMFLNSPVQDAKELRDLVQMGMKLATEGGLSAEVVIAMAGFHKLIEGGAEDYFTHR
jgi:hypothetical protein